MTLHILKCECLMLVFVLIFSCTACINNPSEFTNEDAKLFSLVPADYSGVYFKNTSVESPTRHLAHYDYFYNGSGVAIGDINNDGLPDLFFAGNDAETALYLNLGDMQFKDITQKARVETGKWATGVSMIDINEDGWLDIYVCHSGPYTEDHKLANSLFINNGDLTFTEQAEKYGIADDSYSSQATFFDMDNDGDQDLFVMNHSDIAFGKTIDEWEKAFYSISDKRQKKSSNTLYRNDGEGNYVDITDDAGLSMPGFGLGLAVSDFDENGYLDIYVANDYFMPDFMFFNIGNGKFVENINSRVAHTSFYSMGCDAADFNNDGLIDMAIVDMTPSDHYRGKTMMESMDVDKFKYLVERKNYVPQFMFNNLQLNRSKGNFSEIGQMAGIAKTDWSWAPLLADFDNNAWKDLIITNGFKRDTKDRDWSSELERKMNEPGASEEKIFAFLEKSKSTPVINYAFKNKQDLTFENVSKDWGFNVPSFSQGAAYGDLDLDGDLDLVINNLEMEAFIYRNNSSQINDHNYIQIRLTDSNSLSKAKHANVWIYTDNNQQLLQNRSIRGYFSYMEPLIHFGLGTESRIDSLKVVWPDGSASLLVDPEINKRHFIDKSNGFENLEAPLKERLPFMEVSHNVGLKQIKHRENEFDDFRNEILLPHKQSTLGPALAVGDINNDGLPDFYQGGAKGSPGQLMIQDEKVGFKRAAQDFVIEDLKYEDIGAKFFDYDKDGDLDLYIASGGGGDVAQNEALLQDRLYRNDGKGQFTRTTNVLPKIRASTSCISVHDWDGDGDLDLFIGGRNTPGLYPATPRSYMLQNENGKFIDVTQTLASDLMYPGMITSALWLDIDDNGREDLILAGEWTPILAYLNTRDGFQVASNDFGFPDHTGWWYSMEMGDFDNDGDFDILVGNLGLNNKFHPNDKNPLHIFFNDFDDNGTKDIVLSKNYKGTLVPVRGKECSTEQMPFLKEKFPSFAEFASSSLVDIYGQASLDEALHLKATNFSSLYIENKGVDGFLASYLPPEAQLSPINDMVVSDFNADGNLDVIIAGNIYNTEVETPSYDASKGLYLQGVGDGTFTVFSKIERSGIFMPKDVKQLEFISLLKEHRPAVLVGNNNDEIQLFAWTK